MNPIGFCFLSHKVLRWFTPLFILLSLFTLAGLAFYQREWAVLLTVEVILLLSPAREWSLRKFGLHLKSVRFVAYFVFMNIAWPRVLPLPGRGAKRHLVAYTA